MRFKKIITILFFVLLIGSVQGINPKKIRKTDVSLIFSGTLNISELENISGNKVILKINSFTDYKDSSLIQEVKKIKEWFEINNKKYNAEELKKENNRFITFETTWDTNEIEYFIEAQINTATSFGIKDSAIGKYIEPKYIQYIESSKNINTTDKDLINKAKELRKKTILKTVQNVINYVYNEIEYDGLKIGKMHNASTVMATKKGTCDEYSNLTAALLRINKIPTRVVVGIVFDGKQWGEHAWIEAYFQKQGWVAFDPTFNELNIDGTHITLAKAIDFSKIVDEITHPKKSKIKLFRNIKITKVDSRSFNYNKGDIEYKLELEKDEILGTITATVSLQNKSGSRTRVIEIEMIAPEEFKFTEPKKTIFLDKNTTTKTKFVAKLIKELNYVYSYEFTFDSSIGTISKSIKFRQEKENDFEIKRITADGKKNINIVLKNNSTELIKATVQIYSDADIIKEKQILLNPKRTETFAINLGNTYSKSLSVKITSGKIIKTRQIKVNYDKNEQTQTLTKTENYVSNLIIGGILLITILAILPKFIQLKN